MTFLAARKSEAEERHARRLRRWVSQHSGFESAERILRSGEFDLALIAFWESPAELLPLIRRVSPGTRVVVNSIDIHFLRNARRRSGRAASAPPSAPTRRAS